ncbi:isochorismatase family protein [Kerstersia sp.]|uniref:isochorismatase family protein n=1 Tax=Kerstersia sp. TaxID=1930783 RepID=UPI003F90267B
MLLDAKHSQVVLVDYQTKLMPVMHEADFVVANALRLAKIAQLMQVPVWGTEQIPEKLGHNEPELRELCLKTLTKTHFSGVPDGLLTLLQGTAHPAVNGPGSAVCQQDGPMALQTLPERASIVVAGCETHICLLQTALDLLTAGLEVWVVTDACSSRTERNRDAAFDRLAAAGAELVTTEMVAFEWMRDCQHAAFRNVQRLIK